MCGRFFVDDETWNEIEKIAKKIDRESAKKGDVHPSEPALVLQRSGEEIISEVAKWGYEAAGKSDVLFNARSETVDKRPMFRYDYETRRCVIPVGKFYEWKQMPDKQKEQYEFFIPENVLFLAGIYHRTPEGERFTVLTREAEGCMKGIHHRMPVILRPEDIEVWLFSREEADCLLNVYMEELQRRCVFPAYQQMSIF